MADPVRPSMTGEHRRDVYAFVVMQLVARESAAGEGEDDREEPDNDEATLNYVLDK